LGNGGLARGERPSTLQSAGIALAIVGVVAASLERTPDRRGRQFGAGVGLALAAALCFGWALIGLSRAAPGGIAWSILTMRAVAVPLILVAFAASRPRFQVSSRSFGLLIGVGVGDTVATLLYSTATTRGLLSVVVVLASLYPIAMAFSLVVAAEHYVSDILLGWLYAIAAVFALGFTGGHLGAFAWILIALVLVATIAGAPVFATICPADASEHLTLGTIDAVAYALAGEGSHRRRSVFSM